jgi:hypothetical protein
MVFVSPYGVLEEGYAVTTMHRVLSDLTPLLDRDLGKRLIIGGDFNCSTQRPGRDRDRHRNLFERFATLGLVDLLALTAGTRPALADCPCSDELCRHVQTLCQDGSKVPWHNDYLFATAAVADRLRAPDLQEMRSIRGLAAVSSPVSPIPSQCAEALPNSVRGGSLPVSVPVESPA